MDSKGKSSREKDLGKIVVSKMVKRHDSKTGLKKLETKKKLSITE